MKNIWIIYTTNYHKENEQKKRLKMQYDNKQIVYWLIIIIGTERDNGSIK